MVTKSFDIVMDKEIGKKLPAYSVCSMIESIEKALSMRAYKSDPRNDDRYIDARDGDEILPPP